MNLWLYIFVVFGALGLSACGDKAPSESDKRAGGNPDEAAEVSDGEDAGIEQTGDEQTDSVDGGDDLQDVDDGTDGTGSTDGTAGDGSENPGPLPALTYSLADHVLTMALEMSAIGPDFRSTGDDVFTVEPELPAGISLDSTSGEISGTPTALHSETTYVVTLTNQLGTITADLMMTVVPPLPDEIAYPNPVYFFAVDQTVQVEPLATTDGLSWSIDPSLPPGLDIDAATGMIHGVPTATAATSNYVISAMAGPAAVEFTLAITINVPSPSSFSMGGPYSFTRLVAIDAIDPEFTQNPQDPFFGISPALPDGLSIQPSTGQISGTPSVPSSLKTYTVTVGNDSGVTTSSFDMEVLPITPSNLVYAPNTLNLVKYTAAPTATPSADGDPAALYTISPDLPEGLVLNADTGTISGTPTASSSGTIYSVTATNAGGNSQTTLSIAVAIPDHTFTAGSSTNWSDAANWSDGNVPTSGDPVILDDECAPLCDVTFDASTTIGSMTIQDGYTGTLTQGNGVDLTVAGGWTQSAGQFVGGDASSDLTVEWMDLQGGTFTAPQGTLTIGYEDPGIGDIETGLYVAAAAGFVHNNGAVAFDSGTGSSGTWQQGLLIDINSPLTLNDVSFDTRNTNGDAVHSVGVRIGDGDQVTVQGDLTLVDGVISGDTPILLQGDLIVECQDLATNLCAQQNHEHEIVFTGSSAQTFTFEPDAEIGRLRLDKTNSGDTVTAGSTNASMAGLTITSGTFVAPNGELKLGYINNDFGEANSGTLTVEADGTFTHNSGLVHLVGQIGVASAMAADAIDISAQGTLDLFDFTVSSLSHYIFRAKHIGYASLSEGDTLNVWGDLTITNGTLNGGQVNLHGNLISECDDPDVETTPCSIAGSTAIAMVGTDSVTYNFDEDAAVGDVLINKDSNAVTVTPASANLTVAYFSLSSGDFTAPTNLMTIATDWDEHFEANTKEIVVTNGVFQHNNGTLKIHSRAIPKGGPHVSAILNVNTELELNHLEINVDDTYLSNTSRDESILELASGDTLVVFGDFSMTNGRIQGGLIEAHGDVSFFCSNPTDFTKCATGGTTDLHLLGNTTQLVTVEAGAAPLRGAWEIDTTGTVQLGSDLDLSSSTEDLDLLQGMFDLDSFDATVGANFHNAGTMSCAGGGSLTYQTTSGAASACH